MPARFSISEQPRFPHTKITCEEFPLVLATRIIEDDGDEYFGAFLNRTSVRVLIDFLSRTFRLRSCAITIDGNFEVPCTQYYAKRCVAPCVESLCTRTRYLEQVELVRMFLSDERDLLRARVERRIAAASDALDFESAAFFRDILHNVESYWSQPRYKVWLDDAVDTFELHADDEAVYVIAISQRGRRTLGEIVYAFAGLDDPLRALADVLRQFYIHHLPREIRVSHDFAERSAIAQELGQKFGKKISITVAGHANRRVSAERAVAMTKARIDLEGRRSHPTVEQLIARIQKDFGLSRPPRRIEAFDAAHISGTGFAAAVSVWDDGREVPDEYEHHLSDRKSEPDALRAFIADRVRRTSPDLILVDGGRAQLNAAARVTAGLTSLPGVVGAVKPRGQHASISHFLTASSRVEYDRDDHAHRLLLRLRNDAHDLANATHRLSRDMMHFYELAAILPSLTEAERQRLVREFGSIRQIVSADVSELAKHVGVERAVRALEDIRRYQDDGSTTVRPLIVPIRFVASDGEAEDLIAIEWRQAPTR